MDTAYTKVANAINVKSAIKPLMILQGEQYLG